MKELFRIYQAGLLLTLLVMNSAAIQAQQKGAGNIAKNSVAKRIALVIGNSNYADDIGKLQNPANDAADVANELQGLGFQLIGGKANLDLNLRQMDDAVREFGRQIKAGGVGVFYYSGHGIQVNRVNYLIPLGARIEKQEDARFEALSVDRVLGEMEAAENNLNILILDACRNNPLTRSFRSADKGLAQPERVPTGTYIAFAAKDGQTASDNQQGRNGLYTQELLKNLKQPGLRLEDVFINTRREVRRLSNNIQVPEEYGSVDDIFYFNNKAAGATANNKSGRPAANDADPNFGNTTTDAKSIEREAYRSVQNSDNIADIRAVLEEYPASQYAAGAKARLENLVWNSVKSSKDKQKIQAYLNEFPQGGNAPLARIELRKLNSMPVRRFDVNAFKDEILSDNFTATGLDFHDNGTLYWTNGFDGTIGKIDVTTNNPTILLRGLTANYKIRVHGNRVYFLEAGTAAQKYKDGSISYYDLLTNQKVKVLDNLDYPNGLWVHNSGDIYFTEAGGSSTSFSGVNQLCILKAGATAKTVIANNITAPVSVILDTNQNILVGLLGQTSPGETGKIELFSGDGNSKGIILNNLSSPRDFNSDEFGNIFMTGFGEENGKFTGVSVIPNKLPYEVISLKTGVFVSGITVDKNGDIYYSTSRSEHKLRRLKLQ